MNLGKAIGAAGALGALSALRAANLGESCDSAQQYQPPSLIDGLQQQRAVLLAKLEKLDAAIAAVEANPQVADVLQKLSNL